MHAIGKYLYILLLLTIHQFVWPSITTNTDSTDNSLPVFVSLGRDCEPAKMLKDLGLRTEAYPFDWNITSLFPGIYNMIENNFKDFLNPLFLKYNGRAILHTQYKIQFKHDFPSSIPGGDTGVVDWDVSWGPYKGGLVVDNFLDFLPIIAEKYTRRIDRFMELLNSTKNVVFIRTNLTPKDAEQFVALMTTYYPNLKYQLMGLQRDKNMAAEFQQIPFVKVYYPETWHPQFGGWLQPQEWLEIMTKCGFK